MAQRVSEELITELKDQKHDLIFESCITFARNNDRKSITKICASLLAGMSIVNGELCEKLIEEVTIIGMCKVFEELGIDVEDFER